MRPMPITVHFQAFPSSKILKCVTPLDCEKFFFHSLKQALYVLHGHTRPYNDISVEQQRALWKALCNGDYVAYEQIAATFRPPPLLNTTGIPPSLAAIRSVPIRVLRKDQTTLQRPVRLYTSPAASSSSNGRCDLPPAPPTKGEQTSGSSSTNASTTATASEIAPSTTMKTLRQALQLDFNVDLSAPGEGKSAATTVVTVQGVAAPLDAPLYDLWRLLAHGDLFLYVVLR